MRRAILDIAALSTERHPLPDTMLPPTTDWPVSQKIEDIRRDAPALGLVRISRDGDRYWALVHDVIGRYLLTALFYDPLARKEAGFEDAENPEHLRFLVLRRLSRLVALGHSLNRTIAEEFAISIFKIDPDHGHANFAPFWREALEALDEMPKALHATSRTFRHHSAISRRRISNQNEIFPMEPDERITLLERAVADIRYALENIPAARGGESDLNLYNSLAHAYQDLVEEEIARGAEPERVNELRLQAHSATLSAYRADPDSSYVIETYARSLISDANAFPERRAENAVEVLNIIYAAMERDRAGQRRFNLGKLADTAVDMLLDIASQEDTPREPTVIGVRTNAAYYRSCGRTRVGWPQTSRVYAGWQVLAAQICTRELKASVLARMFVSKKPRSSARVTAVLSSLCMDRYNETIQRCPLRHLPARPH